MKPCKKLSDDLECCANCINFLKHSCVKKEKIDILTIEYPEPNSCCDKWAFDKKNKQDREVK